MALIARRCRLLPLLLLFACLLLFDSHHARAEKSLSADGGDGVDYTRYDRNDDDTNHRVPDALFRMTVDRLHAVWNSFLMKRPSGECAHSLHSILKALTGELCFATLGARCPAVFLRQRPAVTAASTLRAADSFGRPPSGSLTRAPHLWLGDYDQCQRAAPTLYPRHSQFHYCLARLIVTSDASKTSMPFLYGICLPSNCSSSAVTAAGRIAVERATAPALRILLGISLELQSIECAPTQSVLDDASSTSTAAAVLAALAAPVLIATIYDLYKRRQHRPKHWPYSDSDSDTECAPLQIDHSENDIDDEDDHHDHHHDACTLIRHDMRRSRSTSSGVSMVPIVQLGYREADGERASSASTATSDLQVFPQSMLRVTPAVPKDLLSTPCTSYRRFGESLDADTALAIRKMAVEPRVSEPFPHAGSPKNRSKRTETIAVGVSCCDLRTAELKLDDELSAPPTCAPSIALTYRREYTGPWRQHVARNVLLAFSARHSLTRLGRLSAMELGSLHGIRVLATIWVVFGHSVLFSLPLVDTLPRLRDSSLAPSGWALSLLVNASLAVDSFLLISATLLAYGVRKRRLFRMPTSSRCAEFRPLRRRLLSAARSYSLLVFHRLVRIVPALYLLVIVVHHWLLPGLGDGPLWSTTQPEPGWRFGAKCSPQETLAPLLFFYANWTPNECAPWLWHAALDMQLFLAAPALLWFFGTVARRKPLVGVLLVGILCLLACTYRFAMLAYHELPTNLFAWMLTQDTNQVTTSERAGLYYKWIYASPMSRAPPFLIGLLLGWHVSSRWTSGLWNGGRIRGTWLRWAAKIATLLGLVVSMLVTSFVDEDSMCGRLLASLHRTTWSLSLAALIWLCERGDWVTARWILASPKLRIFSRLSFGVYLVHAPLLLWWTGTRREAFSIQGVLPIGFVAVCTWVCSLGMALLLTLLVEQPIINVERRALKTIRLWKAVREEEENGEKNVHDEGNRE